MEVSEQQRSAGLVTKKEYAERIGVNPSTITRQTQSGLIPVHDGLIDPVEADAARKANLDTAKRRMPLVKRPAPETARPQLEDCLQKQTQLPESVAVPLASPRRAMEEIPADLLSGLSDDDETRPVEGTLKAAQIQERQAKAGLADLELARRRGELVPLKEVAELWGNAILSARTKLFVMIDEIQNPTVKAQVDRRLREILADLAVTTVTQQQESAA